MSYKRTKGRRAWHALRSRCNDKNNDRYHQYGGRGIKVCKRWEKFSNFIADMGEPENGMIIDRIDNDGNYCKSNCRWVTKKESNRNRSITRKVKFRGKIRPIGEIAEILSIKYKAALWLANSGQLSKLEGDNGKD